MSTQISRFPDFAVIPDNRVKITVSDCNNGGCNTATGASHDALITTTVAPLLTTVTSVMVTKTQRLALTE